MCGFAGNAKRHEPLHAVSARNRVRYVDDRLSRLPDRDLRNNGVRQGVDRRQLVVILESHVDARSVAGRPNSVRQFADVNRCDLREVAGSEHLNFVQTADGHIRERAACAVREVDMVRDWARIDRLAQRERRPGIKHLGLAAVF